MSKRKNATTENPNKDFCDFLMGKEYLSNGIGLRVGNADLIALNGGWMLTVPLFNVVELANYEKNVNRQMHKIQEGSGGTGETPHSCQEWGRG